MPHSSLNFARKAAVRTSARRTRSRKRRPTVAERKLQSDLADAHERVRVLNTVNFEQAQEIRKLTAAREARIDQTMLAQRIALANSLGQMVEAVSKAINFIVAKEAL